TRASIHRPHLPQSVATAAGSIPPVGHRAAHVLPPPSEPGAAASAAAPAAVPANPLARDLLRRLDAPFPFDSVCSRLGSIPQDRSPRRVIVGVMRPSSAA